MFLGMGRVRSGVGFVSGFGGVLGLGVGSGVAPWDAQTQQIRKIANLALHGAKQGKSRKNTKSFTPSEWASLLSPVRVWLGIGGPWLRPSLNSLVLF
jgi:hypothetical protein